MLAIDFAGTLTDLEERARPDGEFVVQLLHAEGTRIPDTRAFVECFDLSRKAWYEESLPDSMARLLQAVAVRTGVELPPMEPLLHRMWTDLGDHPVPEANAKALQVIHAAGWPMLLATNTCRPREFRARTLEGAGLGFMDLVCSSQIGAAKPDSAFYAAVIQAAGVPPERIIFIGDSMDRDVTRPRLAGMKAAHVQRGRPADLSPERMADGTPVLSRLDQLTLDLLNNWA
ncbi:HAD family hydrolase [Streptomyces sp. MAR4 CNY-716]